MPLTLHLPPASTPTLVQAFAVGGGADPLLVGTPDTEGRLVLTPDDAYLRRIHDGELPKLFFRVFQGDRCVASTETTAVWDGTQADIRIHYAPPDAPHAPAPHAVRGRVWASAPAKGWTLRVFDQPLRGDAVELGRATVGADGRFETHYAATKLGRRQRADLVLVLADAAGTERWRSPVQAAAHPTFVADIVLDPAALAPPTTFATLSRVVADALGDADPADLTRDEQRRIAAHAGLDSAALSRFVRAHISARQLATPALTPEVCYALGSGGISSAALRSTRSGTLRTTLQSASAAGNVALNDDAIQEAVTAVGQLWTRPPSSAVAPAASDAVTALLTAGVSNPTTVTSIVSAWYAWDGTGDFLSSLALDPASRAQVELTLRLGALTGGQATLVSALFSWGVTEPRDLARLSLDDWNTLVKASGVPDGYAEDAAAYATSMATAVESVYPTAVMAEGLRRTRRVDLAPVVAFCDAHPDYALETQSLRRYLTTNPDALSGDVAAQATAVLRASRLFRVTRGLNRAVQVIALSDAGYGSAGQIACRDRMAFARENTALLGGAEEAAAVHARASAVATQAHLVVAAVRSMRTPVWAVGSAKMAPASLAPAEPTSLEPAILEPAILQPEAATDAGLPDLEALFGSLDACACEHCESALSPTAWLTDALKFLVDNVPGAYERLKAQRPDIPRIELTCANTDTVLPYIDLVNEVLESAVVGDSTAARQTTGTADDLALRPEHAQGGAYDILANARFPWALPLDLDATASNAWLPLLATDRRELIRTLAGGDPSAPFSDDVRLQLARHLLGVSEAEQAEITGEQDVPGAWSVDGAVPAWATVTVETWLALAGMNYEALTDTLSSVWVNPPDAAGLRLAPIFPTDAGCNTTLATLGHPPGETAATADEIAAVMGRFARFERLRRRLGWTAWQLDKALLAFGDLTNDSFTAIAELEELRRLSKVDLVEILTWFAPLPTDAPTTDERPLYDRRFLDPSTPSVAFALNEGRTELASTSPLSILRPSGGDPAATIALGALRLSASNLEALLDEVAFEPADSADPPLSLENLSRLYRSASLARALGLKVSRFLALRRLSDIDPFASPAVALRFVAEARAAVSAPLNIEAIDSLLDPDVVIPADAAAGNMIVTVLDRLAETAAETALTADPTGTVLTALLASLFPEVVAVGDPSTGTPRDAVIVAVLTFAAGAMDSDATFVWAALGTLDGVAAIQAGAADALDLAWVPSEASFSALGYNGGSGRLEWVQALVLAGRRATLGPARVSDALASALGLPVELTDDLVRTFVHVATGAGDTDIFDGTESALTAFLDTDFSTTVAADWTTDGPLPATWSVQVRTLRCLAVIARLILSLGVTRGELGLLFESGPGQGWLDPEQLPAEPGTVDVRGLYTAWCRLREVYRLRGELGGVDGPFMGMLTSAFANVDVRATLLTDIAWSEVDLDVLVGTLGISTAEQWQDERWWRRLSDAIALARRTGVAAATLVTWARTPVAEDIRQAARGKYSDTAWAGAARPIQDRLREQQRVALVAYLCGRATDPSGNLLVDDLALYRNFLIDVDMCAVTMTSRVREAMSAVQLHVQQIQLGLLTDISLSTDARVLWECMARYRVWEANRKVFLWPENWMEPELRDDKTPFYEAMEQALLQDEVTAESAETVFRDYLAKLEEVTRLEIKASIREIMPEGETDPAKMEVDRLHVVGRTRSLPHAWYHRVREDGAWQPWRKINVDIQGDHQVLVVWNRRVWLIWATFTEKPVDLNDTDSTATCLEVDIAWSVLGSRGWGAKRVLVQEEKVRFDTDALTAALDALNAADGGRGLRAPPIALNAMVDPVTGDLSVRLVQTAIGMVGGYSYPQTQESFPVQEFGLVLADASLIVIADADGSATEPTECSAEGIIAGSLHPSVAAATPSMEAISLTTNEGGNAGHPDGPDSGEGEEPPPAVTHDPVDLVTLVLRNQAMIIADPALLDLSGDTSSWEYGAGISAESLLGALPTGPAALAPLIPAVPSGSTWIFPPLFLQDRRRTFHIDPVDATQPLGGSEDNTWAGDWIASFTMQGMQSVANVDSRASSKASALPPGTFVLGGLTPSLSLPTSGGSEEPPDSGADGEMIDAEVEVGIYQRKFVFAPFYHPHVKLFQKHLNRYGLDGLLAPTLDALSIDAEERAYLRRQGYGQSPPDGWSFAADYAPTSRVTGDPPIEDIDFSPGGAYAVYNWELFFHAPFHIAVKLSQNQKFADAMRWFHYIFDPTGAPEGDETSPSRFWKVAPLYATYFTGETGAELDTSIQSLMQTFSQGAEADTVQAVTDQIDAWRKNPFSPYAIGRFRTTAFQKAVLRKYLDNLIAWGDSLFREDTTESVNEATLLYVLAAELLGRRPEIVDAQEPIPKTFEALLAEGQDDVGGLDAFSNAIENELVPVDTGWHLPPAAILPSLYFRIPQDEKLVASWDTVDDRLYKIRHSLNIEGVFRSLALFDPPIDPAELVRAAAAGRATGTAWSASSPVPLHRYVVLVQKAKELCGEVRAFGSALLTALEKRDAESLSLLRQTHEIALLEAVKAVKQGQVDEAKQNLKALEKSRDGTDTRRGHYQKLIDAGWSAGEIGQFTAMAIGASLREQAAGVEHVAAVASAVPDIKTAMTDPGATIGGEAIAHIATAVTTGLNMAAVLAESAGSLLGLSASYSRRAQDWTLQLQLADKELIQIDAQIDAARTRVSLAERELANHERQIDQAHEVDDFLRNRFAGYDLYDWMTGQLSSLYVQAYQLALDLARRAQRAWAYELAPATTPTFIAVSHWDSLRKGLLAGEKLAMDLARMDSAWLDQSRRELELTRHVSVAQLDPAALQGLKATGSCEIVIPETFFDVDLPGHYLRRIKTVALSIPCVAGPYAPVHATLTLLQSAVRRSTSLNPGYGATGPDDPRFTFEYAVSSPVVTSQAQSDSGLFEVNLHDERYLPFEGRGAVESRWRIELPAAFRAFDYTSISDVILHLRYTARDGGTLLRDAAVSALRQRLAEATEGVTLTRLISLRNEGSAEWNALLTSGTGKVRIRSDRFPYPFRSAGSIGVRGLTVYLFGSDIGSSAGTVTCALECTDLEFPDAEAGASLPPFDLLSLPGGGPDVRVGTSASGELATGTWSLTLSTTPESAWSGGATLIDAARLREVFVVVQYVVEGIGI